MYFKKYLKIDYGLQQFDMAPLIDVVFILLTFFMLTSQFVSAPGIKVDLPRAVSGKSGTPSKVSIAVTAEGVLYLNSELVTVADLYERLDAYDSTADTVFIKADRDAYFGRVIEVWDVCRDKGYSQINIATVRTMENDI